MTNEKFLITLSDNAVSMTEEKKLIMYSKLLKEIPEEKHDKIKHVYTVFKAEVEIIYE